MIQEPHMEEQTIAFGALREVIDPEIGMNIVDLGLIYEATVRPDFVYVKMTMTSPGCPLHESIREASLRALERVFPGREINVHIVWEPAWTPELMSPEAKMKLGFPV